MRLYRQPRNSLAIILPIYNILLVRGALEFYFMYYVYLMECEDKTLYTGITTNIERRFKEHSLGNGGAYTRSRKVKKVLYTEQFKTRSEASKRESEIKSWRRDKKLALIK